jgi:Ser/Thr protein kinase RdoA (MazF antagonist)
VTELPPVELVEVSRLDVASVERLEWPFPIWTCDVDGERVVIASKRGRTNASLDWEAALLDGLEAAGFPACRAARIFDGVDYLVVDGLHYSARTWVPGRMLVEFDDPDVFAVGRFIAAYHSVATSIALPQRPGITPLEHVLPSMDDAAMLRVLVDARLVRRYRELVDEILPAIADVDTSLPVHGDFTTRNIAADARSVFSGLIDFGMSHSASPAVELAYALGSTRPTFDHVEHRLDQVTELIRGYRSVSTLDPSDPARIVDFARSRPLLGLAIYAIEGFDAPASRISGSFGRIEWLTEHRDEMIAAISSAV